MNYYNFRMYYSGTTATVVRSRPIIITLLVISIIIIILCLRTSICCHPSLFVNIDIIIMLVGARWWWQWWQCRVRNAFVCDGGAAGHPILQNSPKVVIFIAGVPVIVIHLPHFCHCHHHLAGYSKMMMAMTTMSCHKSNHRRVVAASCCGCETHLVLFADQVPIVPWCFPSFFFVLELQY